MYLKSFAEFQQLFGGLWQPSALGYAVEQFFDNGGREALVVRVVNGARAGTLSLPAGTGWLTLRALRPGTREFLRASVDYDNIAPDTGSEFNLTVQRVRVQGTAQVEDQEIFRRLSVRPDDPRYVHSALADSELVEVAADAVPKVRPQRTLDAHSGLATAYINSNADGDDGAPLTDYDVIGSDLQHTGLFALDESDDFNLLCIPPLARDVDVGLSVLLVAARYCRQRQALLIVDPPSPWHTADDALRGMRTWEFNDEHALMYFPRILAYDKLRGHFESFASCGAVAGMLARSDEAHPVWDTAQRDDATLRAGFRPSCLVTDDRRRRLAGVGVNGLQAVRTATRGIAPRTLAGGSLGDPGRQGLAARRLTLFILSSLLRSTRWTATAEPGAELAERATTQVREFFEGLYQAGAFGERPMEEAFCVICENRGTAPVRDFQLVIGFATTSRPELAGFRVVQAASGSSVLPVSLERMQNAQFSPEELDWVERLASRLRP